ncbi:hypothetical protein [Polaribacter filamentus]
MSFLTTGIYLLKLEMKSNSKFFKIIKN